MLITFSINNEKLSLGTELIPHGLHHTRSHVTLMSDLSSPLYGMHIRIRWKIHVSIIQASAAYFKHVGKLFGELLKGIVGLNDND